MCMRGVSCYGRQSDDTIRNLVCRLFFLFLNPWFPLGKGTLRRAAQVGDGVNFRSRGGGPNNERNQKVQNQPTSLFINPWVEAGSLAQCFEKLGVQRL